MGKNYNCIFWGYILIVFDINFNLGIDLFPNIVGYFLISHGLSELSVKERHFKRGEIVANIFAFSEFIMYCLIFSGVITDITSNIYIKTVITLILTILNLIMLESILGGIYIEAEKELKYQIRDKANFLWKTNLICEFLVLIVAAFSINFNNISSITMLLMIGNAIVYIMILVFLRKVGKQLYVV